MQGGVVGERAENRSDQAVGDDRKPDCDSAGSSDPAGKIVLAQHHEPAEGQVGRDAGQYREDHRDGDVRGEQETGESGQPQREAPANADQLAGPVCDHATEQRACDSGHQEHREGSAATERLASSERAKYSARNVVIPNNRTEQDITMLVSQQKDLQSSSS